jgi:hypothetical protein
MTYVTTSNELRDTRTREYRQRFPQCDDGTARRARRRPAVHTGASSPGFLLVLLALLACGDASGPTDFDAAREFDAFWRNFDRTYSYFDYKQIDWIGARDAFRPRALQAADVATLVPILSEMVTPLRDLHVWFLRPDGTLLGTYQPPHFRNWDRTVWTEWITSTGWRQQVSNWGYADLGDIAYIAIGAWNTSQVRIAAVDSVLELLRDHAGIILDVRMNGGGNDALALQVAGRFTTASRIIEYIQFRDGPGHDDFTALQPRTLAPRGPWQYQRPVIVLAGRGVFSSNETFISAMREIPTATIMGDTTGGSSGNPQEFPLFGDWAYTVPRWIAYTADRTVIEWNGIAPDIVVPVTAADFAAGRDPVIEAALGRLRVMTGSGRLRAERIPRPGIVTLTREPRVDHMVR